MRTALLFALGLWLAQPAAAALQGVDLVQRPGARLPLETAFVDESGTRLPLARVFGRTPVVLVLGYYHCPGLCTTLMEGVLQAARATGLPRDAFSVVGISIDPAESARVAARKAAAYRAAYDKIDLQLLTATPPAIERITQATGFRYVRSEAYDRYAHPLAFLVVTPQGRISRYFPGVRFDPAELRLALVEASGGTIGSLSERIFLRCAHFDPQTGRYTLAVLASVRAASLSILALLALGLWRMRRR